MSKHSIKDRIKITKSGKILRRAGGLGHSRANKSGVQMGRKQRKRGLLHFDLKAIQKYL